MLEVLNQVACVRYEDTRVPVELATLHEHLREVALRLFRERFYLVNLGLATQVAQLDIAIAGLRPCRLHTHRQQHIVLRHVAHAYVHAMGEGRLVEYQLV